MNRIRAGGMGVNRRAEEEKERVGEEATGRERREERGGEWVSVVLGRAREKDGRGRQAREERRE